MIIPKYLLGGNAWTRALALSGLPSLEDLVGLATPQVPEREDRRQVLGTRTRLALLPVVDRLRGGTDQKTALGS